nr:hypothetical protein [Tanacetum cinerariifolium]
MAEDLIRKIYNIANTQRGGLLGIKCTWHSYCQVKCSHWQYKFPLPVKGVATARRLEMPLPEVCTAIEEKKKKLPVASMFDETGSSSIAIKASASSKNEPASPVRDVSDGEACPTDSSFIADLDRATIAKSSTLPHDSAPRVTSPAADEGKEEIVKLKERVKVLEDKEDVAATQSGDDAPIKGRTTVLAGGINVPTGSGFIPTAGPPTTVISTGSEVGPTASPIVTRRKGKEVMVESDTPKKNKLQEHIDAQVARELEEQ